MKRILISLSLFIFIFGATNAMADDFSTLQQFGNLLRAKDYANAEPYLTQRSLDLFRRYSAYDLGDLTPANVSLMNSYQQNGFRYLHIMSVNNVNGKTRKSATTVAMVTEQNQPKIDLPETFRLAFGDDWEQKLNGIEQAYLFARQNLGDKQSLAMLHSMLKKGGN